MFGPGSEEDSEQVDGAGEDGEQVDGIADGLNLFNLPVRRSSNDSFNKKHNEELTGFRKQLFNGAGLTGFLLRFRFAKQESDNKAGLNRLYDHRSVFCVVFMSSQD